MLLAIPEHGKRLLNKDCVNGIDICMVLKRSCIIAERLVSENGVDHCIPIHVQFFFFFNLWPVLSLLTTF
jgi:hypothetical protein